MTSLESGDFFVGGVGGLGQKKISGFESITGRFMGGGWVGYGWRVGGVDTLPQI